MNSRHSGEQIESPPQKTNKDSIIDHQLYIYIHIYSISYILSIHIYSIYMYIYYNQWLSQGKWKILTKLVSQLVILTLCF